MDSERFIIDDNVSDRLILHLYFLEAGWGKERGSYPPSNWCWRT
jgi:hypothetical protein